MLLGEALQVSPDEGCFLLAELNLPSGKPGKGFRRIQNLVVIRGDKLARFRTDLGPAREHLAPEFRIPTGVVDEQTGKFQCLHTVGEARDIADLQRNGYLWQPEIRPADLIGGYHDHIEQQVKNLRKQSQFGALHRVQRD